MEKLKTLNLPYTTWDVETTSRKAVHVQMEDGIQLPQSNDEVTKRQTGNCCHATLMPCSDVCPEYCINILDFHLNGNLVKMLAKDLQQMSCL